MTGLFILQSVDQILVRLANMGSALLTQRIHWLLDVKGIPIQQVYDIVTGASPPYRKANRNTSEYINRLDPGAREREPLREALECFVKVESD